MAQGVSKCNIEFKMCRKGGGRGSTKLNCGGRYPPKKFRAPPPQCTFENGIALSYSNANINIKFMLNNQLSEYQ